MEHRDRAQGWKHAKLSGHENERLIAELTKNDINIQERLLRCAHITDATVERVEFGGLCETDVDCVLGGKTKSKTDMWLLLSNGRKLNVSIKKDEDGQVFLVGIERFLRGFALQYHKDVPDLVKRAISLYFGSAVDTLEVINNYGNSNKQLEIRKHRVVAETLKAYDEELYQLLLNWINDNMAELFDFCFAKGLVENPEDWAHIVWYKNMVGENQFDTMICLEDFKSKIPRTAEYGKRNGGSTIQLPFGFVQWHSPRKIIPGNIQFHHSYKKIKDL